MNNDLLPPPELIEEDGGAPGDASADVGNADTGGSEGSLLTPIVLAIIMLVGTVILGYRFGELAFFGGLLVFILMFVGIRNVPQKHMAKKIRPISPSEPSIFGIFSNDFAEAGIGLKVYGPGLMFNLRFFERVEMVPYGKVSTNQFGVFIGRYGPPCAGVFAPLVPIEAFHSMAETIRYEFQAGLNIQYLAGPWEGMYDWKQYLLVTYDNFEDVKSGPEGRLIPSWLTKDDLAFRENKEGKQLLVTCRGKLTRAKLVGTDDRKPRAGVLSEAPGDDGIVLPKFVEVRRIIRPGGFGEILRHGVEVLKSKPGWDDATLKDLNTLQEKLARDSDVCKSMLDLLLKSNNDRHSNYSDIEAFLSVFGGEVEPGEMLYGVDQVNVHAIPGHIFQIDEADLLHAGSGQILTVDASFGIISTVAPPDPADSLPESANASKGTAAAEQQPNEEDALGEARKRLGHYKALYGTAHTVPPGFIGIYSVTIQTATTWAVRPGPFRVEAGKIGERTYFFGQSPGLYGERQVDMHLGTITMTDADCNEISLDIDLRAQARPRVWPKLRYVFGYKDESVKEDEARKVTSWTEFNLLNQLIAPILNGVIAEIIGGRTTAWFYGEGMKDEADEAVDVRKEKQKEVRALEEIAREATEKMQTELGFLGMMFRAMVKRRVGPEEFEAARRGRIIAVQALETAKMERQRNVEQAEAHVAQADGVARAEALKDQRRYQALVTALGPEAAIMAIALEKAKMPTTLAVGGGSGTEAVTSAAIAVSIVKEVREATAGMGDRVPPPPQLESRRGRTTEPPAQPSDSGASATT